MDGTVDFFDPKVLQECLEWIQEVTRNAGQIVREGFNCPIVNVNFKEGFYDLVTEYDGRTEQFLMKAIGEKYPNHQFIAEESSAESGIEATLSDDPTWIIDPIDGTSNFVHKIPLIAIGIALVYRKQVVLAVSYNPIIEEMFTATRNGGAYLNGQRIRVSNAKLLSDSLVADETSIAHLPQNTSRLLGRTFATVGKVSGMRALGSAVLTLAYVAAGRIDAYQIELLKPWDIAGGALLIEEAGGVVRDSMNGGPYDVMRPNVLVAATQELYNEMWRISQECEKKTLTLE